MPCYLVAGNRPWNRRIFEDTLSHFHDRWFFVDTNEALLEALSTKPRYAFFLHWSTIVPIQLIEDVEAIVFHMTALPFGRGGSPLQNLIQQGIKQTKITAFRMTDKLDAGPIYMQRDLSLEGLAEEIYIRASRICVDMMQEIAANEPEPVPQQGRPTYFNRRTPDQSEIGAAEDLKALFDHMRMLDCEGYPKAFLVHEGYRYEFSRPALRDGRIVADVEVTKCQ